MSDASTRPVWMSAEEEDDDDDVLKMIADTKKSVDDEIETTRGAVAAVAVVDKRTAIVSIYNKWYEYPKNIVYKVRRIINNKAGGHADRIIPELCQIFQDHSLNRSLQLYDKINEAETVASYLLNLLTVDQKDAHVLASIIKDAKGLPDIQMARTVKALKEYLDELIALYPQPIPACSREHTCKPDYKCTQIKAPCPECEHV